MACYNPLQAFQLASGEIKFVERGDVLRSLSLPCGQCIGCRLDRSTRWAIRCVHESQMHSANCFITLTYDDKHLPHRGMLDYPAFQKFLKRTRFQFRTAGPVRFYMGGEYGETNWRPHYHALLFGLDFADKACWRKSESGEKLYRSPTLERLWPFGNCEIGRVTFESAAYVARYCVQKRTGRGAKDWYRRFDEAGEYHLPPEFNRMSLKPGIGATWFQKYASDVYPHDYVVINGKEVRPPKYYDKLLNRIDPDSLDALKAQRELNAYQKREDNTQDRLIVKEIVAKAKAALLMRNL